MPKQTINIGTGYGGVETGASRVRDGFDICNQNFTELYAVPPGTAGSPGAQVRYVSKSGNLANSGANWGSALPTIASAMAALPQHTINGRSVPGGTIYVGPGTYTENGPLYFADAFALIGMTGGSNAPTVVRAGNAANLFESAIVNSSVAHHTLFQRIRFDGVAQTQPTAAQDLLKIDGGYNTTVRDCGFFFAPRWGIHTGGGLMNLLFDSCSFGGCGSTTQGGSIFLDSIGVCNVTILQGQHDRCGIAPIKISQASSGQDNFVSIRDVKFEVYAITPTDVQLHAHIVHVVPNLSAGGNPMHLQIENMYANNVSAGWSPNMFDALVYEENQPGAAARFVLTNLQADLAYASAFKSDKTGQVSYGRALRQGTFNGSSSVPAYEMDGIPHFAGTGAPSMAAPNGSLYHRSGGSGLTDNLYIRRAGAWVGIA